MLDAMTTIRRAETTQRGAVDAAMAKVLSHPLRQDILSMLNDQVASPRGISEVLGEPLANVAYHVRTLLKGKLIELVRTEQRRGAVEHYYRALQRPVFSDSDLANMPITVRRAAFDRAIRRSLEDIHRAGEAGGFDHHETHVSRTTLALDEDGWSKVSALLVETYERVLEIQAESAAHMLEVDEQDRRPVNSEMIIMHFRNPTRESTREPG
jgi:DNA-binding transcriptional ArsR family regulator